MATQQTTMHPTPYQQIFGELAQANGGHLATWQICHKLDIDINMLHVQIPGTPYDEALAALIADGLVEEVPDLGERYQLTPAGREKYSGIAKAYIQAQEDRLTLGIAKLKAWKAYEIECTVALVLAAHAAEVRFREVVSRYQQLSLEVGIDFTSLEISDDERDKFDAE